MKKIHVGTQFKIPQGFLVAWDQIQTPSLEFLSLPWLWPHKFTYDSLNKTQ